MKTTKALLACLLFCYAVNHISADESKVSRDLRSFTIFYKILLLYLSIWLILPNNDIIKLYYQGFQEIRKYQLYWAMLYSFIFSWAKYSYVVIPNRDIDLKVIENSILYLTIDKRTSSFSFEYVLWQAIINLQFTPCCTYF